MFAEYFHIIFHNKFLSRSVNIFSRMLLPFPEFLFHLRIKISIAFNIKGNCENFVDMKIEQYVYHEWNFKMWLRKLNIFVSWAWSIFLQLFYTQHSRMTENYVYCYSSILTAFYFDKSNSKSNFTNIYCTIFFSILNKWRTYLYISW